MIGSMKRINYVVKDMEKVTVFYPTNFVWPLLKTQTIHHRSRSRLTQPPVVFPFTRSFDLAGTTPDSCNMINFGRCVQMFILTSLAHICGGLGSSIPNLHPYFREHHRLEPRRITFDKPDD